MLPNPLEDIARKLDEYNKRLSHLERLERAGALVLIEEVVLTAPAATIDFQNIPATFRHLEIFGNLRSDRAATSDGIEFTFNADGGGNYDWLRILLRDVYSSIRAFADTSMDVASVVAATGPAGKFSSFSVIFPNYKDTTIEAGLIYLGGFIRATSGVTNIAGSLGYAEWRDTAAVNRITLTPSVGANWVSGSIVALYGIN